MNGDFFYDHDLVKSHNTFNDGHVFCHHQNKDPSNRSGDILRSMFNPKMSRVELITSVMNDKAPQFIRDIENGIMPAVSMGCKVKFDVCSICGHKSRTRAEYCDHLKYQMNQFMPDGKLVCAINPNPRFFDLSFVTIGAEPMAIVMAKLASVDVKKEREVIYIGKSGIEKSAALITSVDFPVDVEYVTKKLVDIEDSQPQMSNGLLNLIGKTYSIEKIASTMSFLGIRPKPEEFQRMILVSVGRKGLADELDSRGVVFSQNSIGGSFKIDPTHFSGRLSETLREVIPRRSHLFGPFVSSMLNRVQFEKVNRPVEDFSLDKIGQLYNSIYSPENVIKAMRLHRVVRTNHADIFDDLSDLVDLPTEKNAYLRKKIILPIKQTALHLLPRRTRDKLVRNRARKLLVVKTAECGSFDGFMNAVLSEDTDKLSSLAYRIVDMVEG